MLATAYLIAGAIFVSVVYFGLKWLQLSQRRAKIIKENGCKPAPRYPNIDPIFGLDYVIAQVKSFNQDRFLEKSREDFDKYGSTFTARHLGADTIMTRDWAVYKSIMNTDFESWGVETIRLAAVAPLIGRAFFAVDGKEWKQKRAQFRPALLKTEYSDLTGLERHLVRFLDLIPRDGTPIDMAGPLKRLTLTFSTQYFLAEPVDMLQDPANVSADHKEMAGSLGTIQECMFNRAMMGSLVNWLPIEKRFQKACNSIKAFVDKNITASMHRMSEKTPVSHRVFLDELVSQTDDRPELSGQAISLFVGGADTTSASLVGIVWALSRSPEVVEKLREEIAETCGDELPDYETLQGMKYLRAVLHEALRLYSPSNGLNMRVAMKDTILPRGGGPEGKAPLFVKKGTKAFLDNRALHLDKLNWGDDAFVFRPERFLESSSRDFYQYQVFGGGPRHCPGQAFAFTNLQYVTTRLLQEFKEIKAVDDRPYVPRVGLTIESAHGAEVVMVPA